MSDSPKAYLDISINDEKIGRIVAELYKDKAPKAVENFLHLCQNDIKVNDRQLTYKNNYFHRVIKNFMIQAGDILYGSSTFEKDDNIGKGGLSIYTTENELAKEAVELPCYGNFEDENLGEFTEPFMLAMANTGAPNTNSSQFFISTYPAPHLNGKHSIFGKVIHGKSVVRTIEYSKVDTDAFPETCIRIDDCGLWEDSMDIPLYNASNNPIGNDVYEEYPDDDTHFDSENFGEAFNATNIIKESGTLLFKSKDYQNAFFKYKKSLKYVNEFLPELDVDKENNIKFNNLKMKLYLNLSLVLFNLQRIDESINYSTYLLEMDDVPDLDKAKAYYRRGNCHLSKKRLDEALDDYKLCKEHNPNDEVIDQKIEYVEQLIEQKKEKQRKNIAKFFT
ncbi:hypothetical protein KAFR_0F01380 [Kazachstania africana CBS 2517]|uniref:peptidylprolyl isomerase n=1 Tax=Kazachstania africana (strain ATCC 22294 / BCRC 22015 / CBS 2517 / CECT 1963 / NBRC 1671 / NRRL Y-8276) TaxID=1071382 RepID=H2AWI4_KAZAF|nr:hypothetical protein KAFR_0F01380 [Kazachstania africana CBS 2517]CCF58734.1 hypothetical protein KAFR_0F01380 [Kazachstania africana CBS 2517]